MIMEEYVMGETILYYDEMDSPIGPLLLIAHEENAVRIDFGIMADIEQKVKAWGNRYFKNPVFIPNVEKVDHVKQELEEYFSNGRQDFTFNFRFYGTPFQTKVWQALLDVPYGETKTYKDIAIAIENPKAVRAVGGAVNKNPFSIIAPCHRVIGMNGKMVGYGGGLEKKEFLLKHEGVL